MASQEVLARPYPSQPMKPKCRSGPKNRAGETGLGIGKLAIGEPHVDLGDDIELARDSGQFGQLKEGNRPRIVQSRAGRSKPIAQSMAGQPRASS
uniref:Uncharacterized protein n=1 Tax=Cannabis sativa TaxID=3483 RepID=A0A803Q0P5_CANSA